MSEDLQAAERRRRGLPQALDPRNYDPRKISPAAMEQVARAQAVARAEAQAATTVVVATIVSLVTSAFGFVAALAWNSAIQAVLTQVIVKNFGLHADDPLVLVFYAIVATVIAVIVVVATSRFARNIAKRSAIESAMQAPI